MQLRRRVNRNDEIKLGDEVIDRLTDFKGIASARIEYLSGCVRYCVTPKVGEDGKMPDGQFIDWQTLDIIQSESLPVHAVAGGGPQQDPKRDAIPTR